MKCPKCGIEMKESQAPVISVKEVMETDKEFPVKLICYLVKIYSCEKCPSVKATDTLIQDYNICKCKQPKVK
jgi:hypothetical protein